MNLRKKFEEKQNNKEMTKDLEQILEKTKTTNQGALSVNIEDSDIDEYAQAYIIEKHTSVSGHGIRYETKIGVKLGEEEYETEFTTTRGAALSEHENKSAWYHDTRILKSDEKEATIGFKSGNTLDIYKFEKTENGIQKTLLDTVDLERERIKQKQEELKEEAENAQTLEERAKKLGEEIYEGTYRARTPKVTMKEYNGKEIALITIDQYNRDGDASATKISLYILDESMAAPEKILSHNVSSEHIYSGRRRFFSGGATKRIGDVVEEDGELKIPLEIIYEVDHSDGYNPGYETLGKEELLVQYTTKKEEN